MGNEPKIVYIGDSYSWTVSDSVHPASDWNLTVYLQRSGSTAETSSATAIDSVSFAVTASVSGSATGSGAWFLVFDDGVVRETVPGGAVTVNPNPSGSAYDPRSHAQKVLDAIEATLEGRASLDQQSITIAGRTLSRMPIADLLRLRGIYREEVKNEEIALRISAGLGSGRQVLVRF